MMSMKWEYGVRFYPDGIGDPVAFNEALNEMGRDRWELVTAVESGCLYFIFKRPDEKWLEEQRAEMRRAVARSDAMPVGFQSFSVERPDADACFRSDPERRKVEVR